MTALSLRGSETVSTELSLSDPHDAVGLTRTELRRRLCHMLPGVLALLLCVVPEIRPIPVVSLLGLTLLVVLLGFVVQLAYPFIARTGEELWTMNIVRYSAPILGTLILFRSNPEFAAVVATVIAFGDGSATLFGLQFGKRRLPWNKRKTWVGLFAFASVAGPLSALAYWLETMPTASFPTAAICAGAATLSGMAVESLPLNSTDNLRVGLAAAVGVVGAHQLMFS